MISRVVGICFVLASSLLAGACSSITIVKPENGKAVAMPSPIEVKTSGNVTLGDVFVDNANISQINGSHFQLVPSSTLIYLDPGQHTLFVSARDSKLNTNLSESSTFTVSACKLCYTCPAGTVHPVFGQCCQSGACDSLAFANFGPTRFLSVACQKATFPGSTTFFNDLDCIGSATQPVQGTGTTAPSMVAVSFSPSRSGALAHIQAPIGWQSGTNGVEVSITTDNAGKPGTVLETIAVSPIRQQPTPTTVNSPFHIFSNTRPALTAGTTYWLVIAPAGANTVVQWNKNLDDVSIPAVTTLLLNTTTSNLAGPWAAKSNLQELRPAFEIDVR